MGSKKYKVIYEREGCIEVLACAGIYPKRWKLNTDDNKADLVEGKLNNDGNWELEFSENELEKFKESAQVCPAKVIKIINIKTGEEIYG